MVEITMEVFMDDFSVVRDSFNSFLDHLINVLKWYMETNLIFNSKKSHFIIKEGIVLGHKILGKGI